ncbi:coiled-coil domain-containing protein 15-like [Elysia marginata]|uniref:Coiled-coil domain-containing protein 15-like n=1 Tax=Elysia marginata TaxID=1093978 RepID=A0AAV4IJJ2_9GAST|nr:coiled-coil domain-containing protein 15-like [Elysia marginata]
MASRQHKNDYKRAMAQTTNSVLRINKDIMKPIISTDIMGNRNVEVVPVGAWVEPADIEEQPDAIKSAQVEEERLKQLEAEKENRLRSFQREVKQRVWRANQLKRQQLIQEAEQAFERERRVVQQSCLTGEMPRRDTCSYRQDLDMAIKQRLMAKYGEDVSTWNKDSPVLQSHTEESQKATGQARKQLVSKKVELGKQNEKKSKQRTDDTLARDINAPTVTSIVDINVENLRRNNPVEKRTEEDNTRADSDDDEDNNVEKDQGANSLFTGEGNERDGCADSDDVKENGAQIRFVDSQSNSKRTRKKRPDSSKRPSSGRMDAILPNTESEVAARLRRQQTAISRRVFMDREREAVRENMRRQQHKKKIASLKKEKEEVRQQLETLARQQLAPAATSPGTVIEESLEESRIRQDLGDLVVSHEADRRTDEMRRLREMERYLDALRHRLRERVKKQGQILPALCACAESIWDTHPETCANNCFFYRNHRAYARALQSLLVSVATM